MLDLVFYPTCLECGSPAPGGLERLGLCPACYRQLPTIVGPSCRSCGRVLAAPDPSPVLRCPPCLRRPPSFDRLTAIWAYQPPVDAVLRAFKFGRRLGLAAALGRHLASRLEGEALDYDLIVPIPLHWRRRLVRGYDQAEEIARAAAGELRAQLSRVLRRRRPTPAQSRLPLTERRGNLHRAFAVRSRRLPRNARVLLIDDVVTSGATLETAAVALLSAGAACVGAAVLARTPAPGELRYAEAAPPPHPRRHRTEAADLEPT